jgi:hypothetical protein
MQIERDGLLAAHFLHQADVHPPATGADRTRLPGLGRAVEVLEPEALCKSLIDFTEQIVKFRRNKSWG